MKKRFKLCNIMSHLNDANIKLQDEQELISTPLLQLPISLLVYVSVRNRIAETDTGTSLLCTDSDLFQLDMRCNLFLLKVCIYQKI